MPDRASHEQRPKTKRSDVEAAQAFAIEMARHAANTRCNNVIVLDLRGLSPVCDFFVIATGTSARQMRTVADEIVGLAKKSGYPPLASSGYEGETWILVDCVDVVFHVFSAQARAYYDLDNLWGDAKQVDWHPKPAV